MYTTDVSSWSEQHGCVLVPAGTYVTPIQEEAGHYRVTKVSVEGNIKYLLELPRPASQQKNNTTTAKFRSAMIGNR